MLVAASSHSRLPPQLHPTSSLLSSHSPLPRIPIWTFQIPTAATTMGSQRRRWSVGGFNELWKAKVHQGGRNGVISMRMLVPRKFMQRRKKVETFKDAADEADQKKWRRLMNEIDEGGSAVSVLEKFQSKNQAPPRDLILGTLVRFKQLKKWNLVSEVLEWLQTQNWWDFNEMDFLMLITSYGKQGDFNNAERILGHMNKMGYAPSVISHTALMEAYGRGAQYNKAEAVFRRMQSAGPEPSAVTYQIMFKIFVEGDKFKEAEEIFDTLLSEKRSPLKPDQKMFHMMIYMHKKAGSYEKARKLFSLMAEQGIQRSTVTFNSLMSFENNYKEVSKIYDECKDRVSFLYPTKLKKINQRAYGSICSENINRCPD